MADVFMLFLQALMAVCGVLSIVCAIAGLFPQVHHALNNFKKISVEQHGRILSVLSAFPMVTMFFMLLGWGIVFYNGIYAVLWFIPSEWGGVGENGWISNRASISGVLAALCVTITLFQIVVRRKDDEQRRSTTDRDC